MYDINEMSISDIHSKCIDKVISELGFAPLTMSKEEMDCCIKITEDAHELYNKLRIDPEMLEGDNICPSQTRLRRTKY